MSLCRPLLLVLLTVLASGVAEQAHAQAVPQRERGQDPRERGQGHAERDRRGSELSDSVRRIERETRGQVLSAERLQYDGRELNRVKVVDGQGRVRVYVDDPSQRGRGADARTRRDDDDEPNL
ncbi:MAG TPA: hypothetical protein VJ806_12295 [Luteimonas sp.]|nr:hypothetical protein [Luteimonas sp.]